VHSLGESVVSPHNNVLQVVLPSALTVSARKVFDELTHSLQSGCLGKL
jgi:hypothetical protein